MLHLVFAANGMERIRDILRPSDQVVQFSDSKIVLVDIDRYLKNPQSGKIPAGEEISNTDLAAIIDKAGSIKSTY